MLRSSCRRALLRYLSALYAVLTLARCREAVAVVKEASSVALNNVLATAEKPILLEFYSPDCHHCQELEPVLDEVSNRLKGSAIVMRLDMRTTYKLNRQFGVRASPTLMLFKGGEEVPHTRDDLGALRDVRGIASYVMMHVGADVRTLNATFEIDETVDRFGVTVVGLFSDGSSKESAAFHSTAKQWRRYMPFLAADDEATALDIAASFGVERLPAVFIVKELNTSLQFGGNMTDTAEMEEYVEKYSLPLVGHLNTFTYSRFRAVDAVKVLFFYDPQDAKARKDEAVLKRVAAQHSDVVFLAASIYATETSETDRLHLKVGVSDYQLPALAIVAPKGAGSVVYNQLRPITAERIAPFFDRFLAAPTAAQCQVDGWQSEASHTAAQLKAYSEYADMMKERIYTKRAATDISEQAYRKTEKRTKRDILTIYTARWCVYSLQFEQMVQELIDSGELDDILDTDLEIVTVDVVSHPPFKANRVDMVPSMRYLPARYKTVPFYFRGDHRDPEPVLEWVRAYHTMRYVEIPGEAPSPFLKDLQPDSVRNADWLTDISKETEMLIDLDVHNGEL